MEEENRVFKESVTMEYEDMKDRIAHIIRAKNLTAAEFALRLGIQPSNVSHLLAGRNNPSLEFVKKLKETFPEYNLEWIIFGTGPMTVSEPFVKLEETSARSTEVEKAAEPTFQGDFFSVTPTPSSLPEQTPPSSKSDLQQIILVYTDRSFEILLPR